MTDRSLSTEATRLLAALRLRGATQRDRALTHARLAELMGVNVRAVIDAARECLNAKLLVLASCQKPPGVWLGTLTQALAYRDELLKRVRHTAGRVSALDRAIAAHRGQLALDFVGQTVGQTVGQSSALPAVGQGSTLPAVGQSSALRPVVQSSALPYAPEALP